MRYLNFKLASPRNAIELVALGLNWDLHNFAEFTGLRFVPEASAVLKWVVSDVTNAWGDSNNHYRGCELWFGQVQRFEITCQKIKIPLSENRTLAEISELNQDESYYQKASSGADRPSCLCIKFNGGLSLKVEAWEAELRPLQEG
jgi:hypothetical protein